MHPLANFANFETPSMLSKLQGAHLKFNTNQTDLLFHPWVHPVTESLPNRKNSLKFCRRLCRGVKSLIGTPTFSDAIFKFVESFIECVNNYEISVLNPKHLETFHKELFSQVWRKFSETLSSTKNNRICLVTHQEWNTIMSIRGFSAELRNLSDDFKELLDHITFANVMAREVLIGFYCHIMFHVNQIFILTVLFEEIERDAEFCKNISNLEDFFTMCIDPSLYKNYNHKRGKFALECCNKCKICRSSSVLANFPLQLQHARKELQNTRTLFRFLDLSLPRAMSPDICLSLFKIVLACY